MYTQSSNKETMNQIDLDDDFNPADYEYPFENLAMEGGGAKGAAYPGAFKVLQDAGIKIKRYVGSSAGCLSALHFALGIDYETMQQSSKENMSFKSVMGGGIVSIGLKLLPSLIRKYGITDAEAVVQIISGTIAEKLGRPDATFKDLYNYNGTELCVVTVNVSTLSVEYCHLKTTPDMPLITAIYMSMSIPAIFQPLHYSRYANTPKNIYIDGGVACNFPIKAYDGWWLSMKPEDSFLRKVGSVKDLSSQLRPENIFDGFNEKTIGIILFSEFEDSNVDKFHYYLGQQNKYFEELSIPDTTCGRKAKESRKEQKEECGKLIKAAQEMLQFLSKHDVDKDGELSLDEIEELFKREDYPKDSSDLLFGECCTAKDIFTKLDFNKDGKVSHRELMSFFEQKGMKIQERFLGHKRLEVTGLRSYILQLYSAIANNVQRATFNVKDLSRTIGLDTGYVGTLSFDLEDEDVDYLFEQGRRAAFTFLKRYVEKHKLPKKKSGKSTKANECEG